MMGSGVFSVGLLMSRYLWVERFSLGLFSPLRRGEFWRVVRSGSVAAAFLSRRTVSRRADCCVVAPGFFSSRSFLSLVFGRPLSLCFGKFWTQLFSCQTLVYSSAAGKKAASGRGGRGDGTKLLYLYIAMTYGACFV